MRKMPLQNAFLQSPCRNCCPDSTAIDVKSLDPVELSKSTYLSSCDQIRCSKLPYLAFLHDGFDCKNIHGRNCSCILAVLFQISVALLSSNFRKTRLDCQVHHILCHNELRQMVWSGF